MIIETKKLTKYYGKTRGIENLNLKVKKGEIFGFLGPNGAGKTTTIRCMMDFIRPTSGEIKILGKDSLQNSVDLKRKIGYLSSDTRLYDNWTGNDHIELLTKIRGDQTTAKDLTSRLNFNPKIKFRQLSSGNKQKLALILALMSEPEVLILDEPTLGLDPLLQNTIYEILKERQNQGATIFMSSHNLHEVEHICSRVAIIKDGRLKTEETIEGLKRKKIYQITAYFDQKFNLTDFKKISGIKIESQMTDGLILNVKGDINQILKIINQYRLKDLEIRHAELEDIFLEFYKK